METEKAALNRPGIREQWNKSFIVGRAAASRFITSLAKQKVASSRSGSCIIAVDGFLGSEWDRIISETKEKLSRARIKCLTIDIASYYKPAKEIERIVNPLLTSDTFFGRIFDGHLEDLLDESRICSLKEKFKGCRKKKGKSDSSLRIVVICHGFGAANRLLRNLYDFIFFVDVTREELPRRVERNQFRFLTFLQVSKGISQVADIGVPVHLFKLLTYVFYPVLEKYKKHLLRHVDHYIDGNIINKPKIVSRDAFDGILSNLAQYPFRLKPLYIGGPWGGQWIKKMRKLPKSTVNCAWGFEAIAPEMSVRVALGDSFLEVPFNTFLLKESEKIMGSSGSRRFGSFFPIRVHYDDSIDGGNMAIQVHPPTSYVRKHFNERVGQDESYYIVRVSSGSRVFLGVKEGIDREEFYKAVRKSETEGIPMHYERYVNSIPSKPRDLFHIPAGTVHASGRNELVLEVGNSYGYTFHIYDYLRPDLNGRLRPIHADHAFRVMKFNINAPWVRRHLKQKPRIIRSDRDWAEYCLGEIKEIFYSVHRLEFSKTIDDITEARFHILTLVEGQSILVQSKNDPTKRYRLEYSETVIVPACLGEYSISNLGPDPCKVIKIFLK